MDRKLTIQQVDSRKDAQCGKCGGRNKVIIEVGKTRAEFICKECGHKQMTFYRTQSWFDQGREPARGETESDLHR